MRCGGRQEVGVRSSLGVPVPVGAVASFYDDVGNKMKRADCVLQTRLQLLPGESIVLLFTSASCCSLAAASALALKCRCNVGTQIKCNATCKVPKKRKNQQCKIFYLVSSTTILVVACLAAQFGPTRMQFA